MKKFTIFLNLTLLMLGLTACAGSKFNPPEQQRSHSQDAQKELSNDVTR